MLHKCLSITLADIFTNFEEIVFFCFFRVCLFKKGVNLISATLALEKLKVIDETKLFLIFNIPGYLLYFLMIPSIISQVLFVLIT